MDQQGAGDGKSLNQADVVSSVSGSVVVSPGGGRGVHGPAPASASLYGFAVDCPTRDREPLFTSACQWGCQRTAARCVVGLGRKVIPTYPPKPPQSQGGPVFGSTNTVEGEGLMVLRRTVRRRRRWSEALAAGGPSIPLPSTSKRSRHSRPGPPRTVLRGTVNPSSRRHILGDADGK